MSTMLVRLKPHDPRRGCVLKRYTYQGIKFLDERGWYRVDEEVADYLRAVRQVYGDAHSPLAFEVCTEAEARARDAQEDEGGRKKASAPVEAASAKASDEVTVNDRPAARRGRKPAKAPTEVEAEEPVDARSESGKAGGEQ